MTATKQERITNSSDIFQFIKGLILSLIITFACVIIFAFSIKFFALSDGFITPINLSIKAISVFVGTLVFAKSKTKGLVKGILFGLAYTTVAFLLFSALSASLDLSISLLLDYLFAAGVGAIAGIIKVNTAK